MSKKTTFRSQFKSLDFFSTNVGFREHGGESFKTVFGACLSLLIALLVGAYGFNKL